MTECNHAAAGSLHEQLTGLPGVESARLRMALWSDEGALGGSSGYMHAMLIALQRFDAVNIAYGEAAGDSVLAEVSARVQHWARTELEARWIAAHAGGGKFLVVAAGESSRERWQLLGDELADTIAQPVMAATGIVRLSPKIALLRSLEGEVLDTMLDRLALALDKEHKQQGRRLIWADRKGSVAG